MSDDLDALRAAFKAATPDPDPTKKTTHLRRAENIFNDAQESRTGTRPTSESRPMMARFATGVSTMIQRLSTRGAMTATTAIVAIGIIAILPRGLDLLNPPASVTVASETSKLNETPTLSRNRVGAENEQLANVTDTDTVDSVVMAEPMPMEQSLEKRELAQPLVRGVEMAPAASVKAEGFSDTAIAERGVVEIIQVPVGDEERQIVAPESDTEQFANKAPSPVKVTAEEPVSTFSIDVDTAAYSVVRSSLANGYLPPVDAVRVEEMVNYFPYDYAAPGAGEAPIRSTVTTFQTPWNENTQLVHIAIQGRMPAIEDRPPLNLVFLIDTSGSMQDANKLPLLKQSFRLMLGQLDPEDSVAIVTYAGSAGQVLEPTPASESGKIFAALDKLQAGGSTAGQAGLQQAYAVAEGMADEGEVTRVVLATDGDFNVGLSNPDALKEFIAKKRDSGTYLSVLGFGRGNLDDATMQALAQNGNGQAAYIDTLNEAQKVLVDQLTGALFPIANDVKIQMEFNPAQIAEYRLIGYETRGLRRQDFNNDKIDAGEIGAGHTVTALYEVTPVGSPAVLSSPLRYKAGETVDGESDELGFLRLRYKEPGDVRSQLLEMPIAMAMTEAGTEARFATAIAGFGQLLRGGDYLGDWGYEEAITLAGSARGEDPFGYRTEAVQLMRLAESLSGR